MKKLNLLGLSVVTIGLLSGCGSSNTDENAVETGTGYYVDSAVQGVNYKCGKKSGTTDTDGKFTFEVGQDCSFSLAGVPLRTTKADELKDGVKVLENNEDVAQFLQSIDNDHNASNGIQIQPEILDVLTQALADHNSTGKVPTDRELDGIVTRVRDDIPTFNGRVKTPEEARTHLLDTQTGITKALASGKTFYNVNVNPDGSVDSLEKDSIDTTATVMRLSCIEGCEDNQDDNSSIKIGIRIVGNSILFETGDKSKLIKQTNDYLLFEDSDGKHYLYSSEAKAKAYYDTLVTSSATTAASIASDLIVGKTYYLSVCDSYAENGKTILNNHVETLVFGTDNKVHDTWIEDGEKKEAIMDYSIDGNTLSIVTPDRETLTYSNIKQGNDVLFSLKGGKLYSKKADAEAYLNSCNSNAITSHDLNGTYTSISTMQTKTPAKLLAGKTFYVAYNDNDVNTVEKHIINADATHDTWTQVFGQNNSGIETISTNRDIVIFSGDDDTKRFRIINVNDNYIEIKDADDGEIEKLYFSLEDAKASFNSTNSDTTSNLSDFIVGKTYYVTTNDSYTEENGNTVNNDHVEKLVFGRDGKVYDTWLEKGIPQKTIMDYTINGDILSIVTPDDGTMTFTNVEKLSTNLRFTDAKGEESGRFFFTYADAQAALGHN